MKNYVETSVESRFATRLPRYIFFYPYRDINFGDCTYQNIFVARPGGTMIEGLWPILSPQRKRKVSDIASQLQSQRLIFHGQHGRHSRVTDPGPRDNWPQEACRSDEPGPHDYPDHHQLSRHPWQSPKTKTPSW